MRIGKKKRSGCLSEHTGRRASRCVFQNG
uniref:Uncharacterized protein n=1 Tax=Anopheles dirus TaxID=7168 RepID=A0A182NXS4_9DIPT